MANFRIWFVCVAISGFMTANWIMFAFTGLNLLEPMSSGQFITQVIVFAVCTIIGFVPMTQK